jgi:hypothetical protein
MKKVYTLTDYGQHLVNTPTDLLNQSAIIDKGFLNSVTSVGSVHEDIKEALVNRGYLDVEEKKDLKPRMLVLTDKFIKENTEFENAVTVLEKYDEYAMEKFSEAFMDHNDSDFGETRKFCNMILSNKNEKIGEDEWETGKEYLPFSEDDEDIQSWHGELDEIQPYLNPMIKAGYLKIIG